MRIETGLLLLVPLALGACAHDGDDSLPYLGGPTNFGEANRMTMAAQVIDPDPVYDSPVPETHAEHAGQAVDRYRQDKVKMPERTRTTDSVLAGEDGQ